MLTVTRFAPSPTGRLHLGHAWSALIAHDLARMRGGMFRLRIEDIDGTRSRTKHVAGIFEDLEWLGLSWAGEVVFQSARLPIYEAALARLSAMGLLYPCYCTRADIAASTSAPHGPSGTVYPGTCRNLTEAERQRRVNDPHAWRLDVAAALSMVIPALHRDDGDKLWWHDERAGWLEANPLAHGDVVLARKDAPASYHLAVTIDDAAQGVTDVVRGEDLFAATDIHRLLQALFDLPTPAYHHHPLLTDARGNRLAKRDGAPTLASLRDRGIDGRSLAEELRRDPLGFRLQDA